MVHLAAPELPPFTLWHDPRCAGCQRVVELLRLLEVHLELVDLAGAPPTAAQVGEVVQRLGAGCDELWRPSHPLAQQLGLAEMSGEALARALAEHPQVLAHPVGLARGQARVGRPPERVLELLIPEVPGGLSPGDFARQLLQGKIP